MFAVVLGRHVWRCHPKCSPGVFVFVLAFAFAPVSAQREASGECGLRVGSHVISVTWKVRIHNSGHHLAATSASQSQRSKATKTGKLVYFGNDRLKHGKTPSAVGTGA